MELIKQDPGVSPNSTAYKHLCKKEIDQDKVMVESC